MRRFFPNFRWSDVAVLAAMLAAALVVFSAYDSAQVWRDGAMPAVAIVIYAIWSWRRA
jgi:hypothetical protein